MPKVSIVAPVYGVEKYIEKFLDSIHKQTFQDLEVILVDDGSPDNCPEILERFAAKDERYKVIHQENSGVAVARNNGLKNASGEYVYIVDSDDWLEQTAIEKMYNEVLRSDADIVYGNWVQEKDNASKLMSCFPHAFVTEDVATIKMLQCAVMTNSHSTNIKRPEFEYCKHFGGAPWRALIRTEIIKKNGLKFEPYVRGLGDDILFTLNLYEYIQKLAYIQDVIYHYRKLEVTYSHGYKANYLETVNRIYEKTEQFLIDKDNLLWSFYYFRVLLYLQQGMDRYFTNPENPDSEHIRYESFKKVVKTSPYCDALKKAPLNIILSRKQRYSFLLLKWHFCKIYWLLNKKS